MKNIKNILSTIQFFLLTAVLLLFTTQFTWGVNPSVTLTSYYANADGKSGSTLRTTLGTIIASNKGSGSAHNVVSYDNIGYLLKYADTQNANGTTLIDIYTPCTFTISGSTITWSGSCNGATNVGCGLNREHTVPQSWFSKASPMVSDAFHIYATDAASNGHRSDYYYGECTSGTSYTGSNCNEAGKLGSSNWTSSKTYTANGTTYTTTGTYSGTVYEPADEYKGDIARGFFYMATRYASACSSWGNMFGNVNGLTQYTVDLMLKWHRQDPVSEKELIRNEVIYGNTTYNKAGGSYYQGNRNPFIDYPCLVEYIWGSLQGQSVSLSSLTSAYSSSFSGEGCAGGSSTTNYTITWNVKGSTSTTTSSGSSVGSLPSTPADCSTTRVFVGWTKNSSVSSRPSDLFTTAAGAPAITGNTTFYAVYADASTSGGSSSGSKTFTFSTIATANNWENGVAYTTVEDSPVTITANGGGNNGKYYTSDTSWRMYNGGSVTISVNNGSVTSITSTPSQTFTIANGEATLSLSATVKFTVITVNYTVSGGTTTYSNYSLSCSSSSTCTTAPSVGAASSSNVTTNSATATCSSGITSLGSTGCTITSYGFVYGKSSNPSLTTGTQVQVGTSYTTTGTSFTTSLSGLDASTTYYVRPYATNGYNTAYGSQASFTTKTPTQYTITWSVDGTTSTVTYNEGESLALPSTPSNCSSTRVFMGWTETSGYTGSTAPTNMFTTASGTVTANKTYYAVYADKTTTGGSGTSTVTDALTYSLIGLGTVSSGNATYTDFTGVSATSDAVYAGNINKFNSSSNPTNVIQLRSSGSNSGIVTTTTGGTATNVTVSWNASTADTRTLNVYGKTSAYSAATDLYLSSTQGTLIGTIVKGTSTSLDITGNYTYIGVRSNGSAMYLDELDITWSSGGSGTITYSNYSTSCTTTPTTYNITYKDQGGGTFSGTHGSGYPTTHTYGTATTLVSPTKTGYDFGGWFTTSACTGTAVTTLGATAYTADITLYAKWTAKTYNITYKDQGNATFSGTHGSGYPTTHTYGTTTTLVSPTKTGYTFGGWFTNSNCTGTAITTLGATAYTADITLYAKWTAKTYNITYKDQGNATFSGTHGSGYPTTHTYGTTTTLVSPTKTGYTFGGWFTNSNCTGTAITTLGATAYTADITLYAKWTQNTYNFTIAATPTGYGSVSTTSITGIPHGSSVTTNGNKFTVNGTTVTATPATATAQYTYAFSQWNNLPTTVTANVTNVQAVFTRTTNTYTVTFNANGHGTAPSALTGVEYNSTITAPTEPTAAGWAFGGWYKESGCTNAWNFSSDKVTGNTVLYAKWTALPTYTVTFMDGTSTYYTKSGYEGQTIAVTDPTPCDGFTFVGWSTQQYSSDNTTTPTIDYNGTVPSGNTTYYAVYSTQGNPTTTLTNNYAPITSLDDLTEGNYLVVGNYNSNYYAMRAAQTGTYYLNQTQVYPSSNVISSPAANLIWQITVDGSNNITLFNNTKFVYASRPTSSQASLTLTQNATGIYFTPSVSGSIWTFTSNSHNGYKIRFYGTNTTKRFELSNSTANTYLYKQQTQTTYTTYYTTDTSFTIEANPNNTTYGSTSITEL